MVSFTLMRTWVYVYTRVNGDEPAHCDVDIGVDPGVLYADVVDGVVRVTADFTCGCT